MGVVESGRRNLHDHAAALGELHRIGQIVQQDLPHAAVVGAQHGGHRRRELDAQIKPFVRSALRDQGDGLVDGAAQIEYLLVQYQHAGLDLGEVENVVDDAEQVVATLRDGIEAPDRKSTRLNSSP